MGDRGERHLFPEDGADGAGVGAFDAERERDEFVVTLRNAVEHNAFDDRNVMREELCVRGEIFAVAAIHAWRVDGNQTDAAHV